MITNKVIPKSEIKPLNHIEVTIPPRQMTPKDLQLCVDLDWSKVEYPCIVEPKIDGFRCLVTVDEDGTVHAWSRSGREWPKVAAALSELSRFPGCWIDGELVIGGSWATTNAAMKRDQYDVTDLNFVAFAGSAGDRAWRIYTPNNEVNTTITRIYQKVVFSRSEVEVWHRKFLKAGFEGIVVKRFGAPYTPGRSGNWMKLKPQQTQDVFKNGKWLEKHDGHTIRVREFDR